MKTKVHYNLHKHCLSVVHGGERVKHSFAPVALVDVMFNVSLKGHARIISRQCREVCAWVTGEQVQDVSIPEGAVSVRYNPYRSAYFTTADGLPVHSAKRVVIIGNEVLAVI